MERFNLKNLNNVEIKVEYQVTISNRFAALKKKTVDSMDICRSWRSCRDNINASATVETAINHGLMKSTHNF
jgi:hypothetical protein